MNGWTNEQTWHFWTETQNSDHHYVMLQRWAREAKGDVEKLADVLEKTWGREDVNYIEIAIALLEGVEE
jgi:hypothetical protein